MSPPCGALSNRRILSLRYNAAPWTGSNWHIRRIFCHKCNKNICHNVSGCWRGDPFWHFRLEYKFHLDNRLGSEVKYRLLSKFLKKIRENFNFLCKFYFLVKGIRYKIDPLNDFLYHELHIILKHMLSYRNETICEHSIFLNIKFGEEFGFLLLISY